MEGSKKKRLVFVCNVDYFFISHRLPLAVAAIEKGYDVYVLSKDTGSRHILEEKGVNFMDVPFERSGTNPIHELRCVCILARLYKAINPDVIHHITLKCALLGSLAAKITKHTHVVNAISGFGYNFTNGRDGVLQKIIKRLIRISFKSKDFQFILQNPDDLKTVDNLRLVPSSHLHLIKGSGVDLEEYTYAPLEVSNPIVYLFPARLLYDKGLMEFLDAAWLLRPHLKDKVRFVLAGDYDSGNLASISDKDLNKKLIPGYIDWIGYKKNMYDVYLNSTVVVLPSYREGLPKSLIEACAVGRPIITTNVPGCRECVINGENGYLVSVKNTEELAKVIQFVFKSKEKLIQMGEKSRGLAEKEFSLNTVVTKTFNIYNLILNG